MADDGQNFGILQDLQVHLRTARVPLENLSTLVQEGDEQLVERFLSENVKVEGQGQAVVHSQLYIGKCEGESSRSGCGKQPVVHW
ncbi:hypothetical protein DPMN_062769 [Dreissena polymorpha]|uniref:Uncharacterized protein n=1 Tax=Dreissena polymorpha TaxID=45954 RepID=A0A9D4HI12_DREPO|nr:hypothetical protein DPMN_062769 [Dreissena polymorpha]